MMQAPTVQRCGMLRHASSRRWGVLAIFGKCVHRDGIHILVRSFFAKKPQPNFQCAAACFKTPINRPQKQVLRHAAAPDPMSVKIKT